MDKKTFDEQYERAKEAAKAADATEPRARHAQYSLESNLVIVYLRNEKSFGFPPSEIAELSQASSEELAGVEVTPSGDGLYWPALDVDLGMEFLMSNFADSDGDSECDDSIPDDLLNQLFAQIEIAWIQNRDVQLVDQLAERHPECKDELYEFFRLLIDGELGDPNSNEEVTKSTERTKEWLTEEGYILAAEAAKESKPHSTTIESQHTADPSDTEAPASGHEGKSGGGENLLLGFMGLLQLRTGLPPHRIQEELAVPDTILTFVQDNPPEETPVGARKNIVGRAVKRGWVGEEEGEEALCRVLRKAAFRPTPFPSGKPGEEEHDAGLRFGRYIEMINKSRLKKDDKKHWLAFAKQEENG